MKGFEKAIYLKMPPRYGAFTHTALLLLLCGLLYFPYLGTAPFFNKGEPREAMAVQDIVRRGEWLVPLKRATDVPSKPPLFHWFAAVTYHVTGNLDETTVRFPSALFATLGVLLVYFLARRLFTPDIALLAGAILATTMIYQDQALDARVDMTLCFFVTLSLGLFYSLYRGILKPSGLVLCVFCNYRDRNSGEGSARAFASGFGGRRLCTAQAALGFSPKILSSSRCRADVDLGRGMVRRRNHARRRRILRSPDHTGKSQPVCRRFRPQPSGLLLCPISFCSGTAVGSPFAGCPMGFLQARLDPGR